MQAWNLQACFTRASLWMGVTQFAYTYMNINKNRDYLYGLTIGETILQTIVHALKTFQTQD